jgi:cardiolipin synthase A/B
MSNLVWAHERLHFDNDEYFDSLVRAIDSARECIEFEMYIFNPDELGKLIEIHLERAARRGVNVRLLIDGIGALSWVGNWSKTFRESGVEIRIWNPIYSGPFWSGIIRTIRRKGLSRFFLHINRRTHRKYVIIDKQLMFVGSQNVSRLHMPRFVGKEAWRDIGIELRGDGIKYLSQAFEYAWDRSYTPEGKRKWFKRKRAPRLNEVSPVRLNLTPWLRRKFWRDLINRINAAEERVWITTPYLAPARFLIRALTQASHRGADVRILVPARSDVFFMRWVALWFAQTLVKNGVRVFEFQPQFLHAKSIIIDDWATVGTTNLNIRSLMHDLEVDIVVTGSLSRGELEKQFEANIQNAKEMTKQRIIEKAWAGRLGRIVATIFKYWV